MIMQAFAYFRNSSQFFIQYIVPSLSTTPFYLILLSLKELPS